MSTLWNYNCKKGSVKWTHRFMMFATILSIIGMILIIYWTYNIIYKNHDVGIDYLYSAISMFVIFFIIMFACMINAYLKGCYKTAFAISYLIPM